MAHVINEELKRLEPTETKCKFCLSADSQSMDDNYFVPLFKENDRTNIIVYQSVKYTQIDIGISRCPDCLKIHEEAIKKANIYLGIISILIFLFSCILWEGYELISLFPCLALFIFNSTFASKIVHKKGILSLKEGAEGDETVQDFIFMGWSFTQPSA